MASARRELLPYRQKALGEEREVAGSRQGFFALLIHSEGEGTALKKLLWWPVPPVLVHGEKSGNACDGDTPLRGSPPSVACEPIAPTPAMARTKGAGWTSRRFCLPLALSQGKHLYILPTPVGHPSATKRAPCHIHPSHRSEKDRLAFNRRRRRQEVANGADSASAIPFGPWRETLLAEGTWQTIGLVGQIDGPLS
jgi:hypothetical protein